MQPIHPSFSIQKSILAAHPRPRKRVHRLTRKKLSFAMLIIGSISNSSERSTRKEEKRACARRVRMMLLSRPKEKNRNFSKYGFVPKEEIKTFTNVCRLISEVTHIGFKIQHLEDSFILIYFIQSARACSSTDAERWLRFPVSSFRHSSCNGTASPTSLYRSISQIFFYFLFFLN